MFIIFNASSKNYEIINTGFKAHQGKSLVDKSYLSAYLVFPSSILEEMSHSLVQLKKVDNPEYGE